MAAPYIVNSRTDFAAIMRGEREARGMSGADMDARIGFPDGYASKAENGAARPWGRSLFKLTPLGEMWLQGLNRCLVVMDIDQAARIIAEHAAAPVSENEQQANTRIKMRQVRVARLVQNW